MNLLDWTNNHRRTTLIAVVLLLGLVPYFLSRFSSQFRKVEKFCEMQSTDLSPTRELKILAMNIAHGRGATDSNWEERGEAKRQRIQQLAKFIAEQDADIVVLNEVDFHCTWSGHQNQAEFLARESSYPNRVEQRNLDFRFIYGSWDFGNAVLSRLPIENVELVNFPSHRGWEPWLVGHKCGARVTIRLGGGRSADLYPIHLESRSEGTRVRSIRTILDSLQDRPTILVGDFNSSPTGFPTSQENSSGENTIDLLLATQQFQSESTDMPRTQDLTFPTNRPVKRIDWCFVSDEFEIIDYRVIESDLSDHFPIMVTLSIK